MNGLYHELGQSLRRSESTRYAVISIANCLEINTVFSFASSSCVLQSFHFVVGRCSVCWYLSSHCLIIIYLSQSLVDAHTAHHLYHECLKGELMQGRTVILVSHHVQLCAPGASYITALDNGRVLFEGSKEGFYSSSIMKTLVQTTDISGEMDDKERKVTSEKEKETVLAEELYPPTETSSTVASSIPASIKANKKPPRKLVEEEKRAVGHIGRDIWETYIRACGNVWYWLLFIAFLIIASASPVLENGWLRYEVTYRFDNLYVVN